MKREYSYVELTYLIKEWQNWIGARISRIVMAGEQLSFELYKTGGNKTNLNVLLPMAWTGKYSVAAPLTPQSFCAQLRKLLEGKKIKEILLVKGERIILVELGEYTLVLQLFAKGNVIVLKDSEVVAALRRADKLEIKEKEDPAASKTKNAAIITGMIGKLYAKEALQSKITLKKLFGKKIQPCVVKDKESVVDIVPFPLAAYKQYACENYESYNEAVNAAMKKRTELLAAESVEKSFDAKIQRLKNIITAQEIHLEKQKQEVQQKQEAGELIYENYSSVKEILDVLQQAHKKFTWEEIRAKLKNHKVIKNIDEKKGKIIIELSHS